jgi:hypothetical protein
MCPLATTIIRARTISGEAVRDLRLVKRCGHKGYTVPAPEQLKASVAMFWERLASL